MQYKRWLNLLIATLALNVTTFSLADEDIMETEEVEAVIETPAEQMGESEFEASETEDNAEETEEEENALF